MLIRDVISAMDGRVGVNCKESFWSFWSRKGGCWIFLSITVTVQKYKIIYAKFNRKEIVLLFLLKPVLALKNRNRVTILIKKQVFLLSLTPFRSCYFGRDGVLWQLPSREGAYWQLFGRAFGCEIEINIFFEVFRHLFYLLKLNVEYKLMLGVFFDRFFLSLRRKRTGRWLVRCSILGQLIDAHNRCRARVNNVI